MSTSPPNLVERTSTLEETPAGRSANSTADATKPQAQLSALLLANLILFWALGVGVCWWIYHYTDKFETTVSLLALGGVFSWLAFFAKVLPAKLLESLQAGFEEYFLRRWYTFTGLLMLAAILSVAGFCYGAIQVREVGRGVDLAVWVQPEAEDTFDAKDAEPLPAGGLARHLVRVPFRGASRVRVKVSGLPDIVEAVTPWHRRELQVPDSFLSRPIVLLRPTIDLLNNLRGEPMRLVVKVGSDPKPQVMENYDGRTIWIGCDADVDVPPIRVEAWRAELATHKQAENIYYWTHPRALPGWRLNLQPGQEITVQLLAAEANVFAQRTFQVLRAQERQAFPQEELLDVPKKP